MKKPLQLITHYSLLITFLLLAAHCSLLTAFAQGTPGTVRFPGDVDTLDSLFGRLTDAPQTTLSATISSSATTITVVASGTNAFGSSGSLKIDSEIIYYTGKTSNTFTGCVRGRDGTVATSHVTGSIVRSPILSVHHRTLVNSAIAEQTKIGTGASTPTLDKFLVGTGAGTSAWRMLVSGDVTASLGYLPLRPSLNLSDVVSASTSRTNLGLGTMAIQNATSINVTGGTLANITCTDCTNVGSATNGAFSATGDEVINYDSDANGAGVFRVQRGGLDKLVGNNNGSFNFASNVGINTASPSAKLHITVTGAGETLGLLTPDDAIVDYRVSLQSFVNTGDARKNQVFGIGWNLNAGGGAHTAGEGFSGISFESNYHPAADANAPYLETHLVFGSTAGTQYRPLSLAFSKVTNDGVGRISIGNFKQTNIEGNVDFSEITSTYYKVFVPTQLNGGDLKVAKTDGSQLLHLSEGETNKPLIRLGHEADDPSLEAGGNAAPTASRIGGSLFLRTAGGGGLAAGNGAPLYVRDGVLGVWLPVQGVIKASATLDFGSIAAHSSAELSITATGAAQGDQVEVGVINSLGADGGLIWKAYVYDNNDVRVRLFNITASAIDPPSMTYKVQVVKY